MQFPPLPTDNLYKFVALGFLSLFALVLYLSWLVTDKQADYVKAMELERELAHVRMNEVRQLATTTEEWYKAIAETEKERIRVDSHKPNKTAEFISESLKLHGMILLFVTGFISVVGFLLWYWKVQRHQDALLKLQVSELRRKTEISSDTT